MLGDPLLQVRELRKVFPVEGGRKLVAVDGVDLEIKAGETLALVGESGSGKSTMARCIVRLVEPSGGDVAIGGDSILGLQPSRLAGIYRRIQMVFQDPNASLNPRMNVRQVLEDDFGLACAERQRYVPPLVGEIARVADAMLQGAGVYSQKVHVLGELRHTIACSIEKAKAELGYAPAVELREGMRESVRWCLANGLHF